MASLIASSLRELNAYITVEQRNRGMDLEGFFNSLLAAQKICRRYDIILKLHSKHKIKFIHEILDPLLGTPQRVTYLSRHFDTPQVGLVIGSPTGHNSWKHFFSYSSGQIEYFAFTLPLENEILRHLNLELPLSRRYFVGGSMFAVRGDILFDFFTENTVEQMKSYINDEESLDANWFGVMSRTYENSMRLRLHTTYMDLPGNSLYAHHQPGFLPDAQFEHALERVLTYLVIVSGLKSYVYQTKLGKTICTPFESSITPASYRFDMSSCLKQTLKPICLQKAFSGECLIQPASTRQACKLECKCLHSPTGRLRDQLLYFRSALVPHQLAGPFEAVNQQAKHILACLESPHGSRLLHFFWAPVYINSTWTLNTCSRVVASDGSQLLLGTDGNLWHFRGVHAEQLMTIGDVELKRSSMVDGRIFVDRSGEQCTLSQVFHRASYTSTAFSKSWACSSKSLFLHVTGDAVEILSIFGELLFKLN
jgi:hypothetical protein